MAISDTSRGVGSEASDRRFASIYGCEFANHSGARAWRKRARIGCTARIRLRASVRLLHAFGRLQLLPKLAHRFSRRQIFCFLPGPETVKLFFVIRRPI